MLRLIPVLALLLAVPAAAQTHYTDCTSNTGSDATLVFPTDAHPLFDGAPLQPGDEVAAFTPDGLCAGVVVWPENAGSVVLTLWGNNPVTEAVDGFLPNEPVAFRLWSSTTGAESAPPFGEIQVVYRTCDGLPPICRSHGLFEAGTLTLVDGLSASPGGTTGTESVGETAGLRLGAPYPNPASHTAYVRLEVEQAHPLTLTVIDALGRTVRTETLAPASAGSRTLEVDVRSLPAGVYFVQLSGAGQTTLRPLTVIR